MHRLAALTVCSLAFLSLSLPASAAGGSGSAAAGSGESLQLAMTLYAGGITLGKVDMDAKFLAGKYHVVSNLETKGVVNVFWQSEIQATSSGLLNSGKMIPELYTSFYTGHNARHQEVSLRYENGYPAKLYANPPYNTRKNEIRVTDDQKKGTFDPLSAVVFIASGVGASDNPCDLTAPVYDGRRRYSIRMKKIKATEINMDNGLYKGPGLKCEIIYKQISGYKPRVLRETHFPKIYALMAQIKGKDGKPFTIPMRVWARSQYGTIAAVATSLKLDGAKSH